MSNAHKSNWVLLKDLSIFLLAVALVGFFVYEFWSVFFPFVISIIIAYLLNPLIGKICVKLNLNRIGAVLLIYFVFFGLVAAALAITIPLLIKEIALVQANLPTYLQYLQEYADKTIAQLIQKYPNLPIKKLDVIGFVTTKTSGLAINSFKNVPTLLRAVGDFVMNLIFIPFITFFLLKDGPVLKQKLYELIPNQYYEMYRNLTYRMDKQLGNYIRGQTLDALICGILSSLGLWLIGVKYFFIIGMLAGVANLIPYFGPVMGMIPAIFVSIMDKGFDPHMILVIVITFVIVQLFDNLVVNPVVVGNSVELHPLIVMISIMVGGAVGGLFAMLLVVPFVSVMRIVIIELSEEFKYRKYLTLNKTD